MAADIILLVEDNPIDLELAQIALKHARVFSQVVVARDGEEALDYLWRRGAHAGRGEGEPRVVLLDLKLPKLDGLAVLRAAKADPRTSAIPMVVMTSSQQEDDIVRGYQLGANSYIRKPVDFDQFRTTIRDVGLYWLLVNEPPPIGVER
jgi:CheY-like chemotaxis protein